MGDFSRGFGPLIFLPRRDRRSPAALDAGQLQLRDCSLDCIPSGPMVAVMNLLHVVRNLLIPLLLACASPFAVADAYEAKLPDDLHTAPELCKLVPCADVLPGATV